MSMPNPPAVTSWRVTGSIEQTQISTDGTPVTGLRVSYITGNGGTGTVFVPAGQASVDNIRALVADAAGKTDQVNSLSSES